MSGKNLIKYAALVLAVIVLVVGGYWVGSTKQSPAPPTPATAGSYSPPPVEETDCPRLAGGRDDRPLTAAPTVNWSVVWGFAVPAIDGMGPGKITSEGGRYCFAHSPTGALLAAANYMGMGMSPDFPRLLDSVVIQGPEWEAEKLKPAPPVEQGLSSLQIRGFRQESYSADESVVRMLIGIRGTTYGSAPIRLLWVDGQWRWAPVDGQMIAARQEWSPSGFIAWGM